MYVTVNDAQLVGPTNHYKEGWVLPDLGKGASGLNSWGGITATPGDFNPERVKIDFEKSGAAPTDLPLNLGDRISSITRCSQLFVRKLRDRSQQNGIGDPRSFAARSAAGF